MKAVATNVLGPLAVKTVAHKLTAGSPRPFSKSVDASNKGNGKYFRLAVTWFDPATGG